MKALIATLQPKPEHQDEMETLLRSLVTQTRGESGVLSYRVHRENAPNGAFVVYEMYQDESALEHHLSAPYVQSFMQRLPDLLAEEPQITFCEPLDGFIRESALPGAFPAGSEY